MNLRAGSRELLVVLMFGVRGEFRGRWSAEKCVDAFVGYWDEEARPLRYRGCVWRSVYPTSVL